MIQVVQMISLGFSVLAIVVALVVLVRAWRLLEIAEGRLRDRGAGPAQGGG